MLQSLIRLRSLMLLLIVFAVHLAAGEDYGMVNHQSWSTEEGLPQNSVHQIVQSHDGYLWLATEGGVVRFDGASFKVFRHESQPSFISNDVSSIAEDHTGALWFGTADGLVRYKDGQFHRLPEFDSPFSSSILFLSVAGDGSLLIVTDHDLIRYDGGQFRSLRSLTGTVSSANAVPDGSVWFMIGNEELQYRDGELHAVPLPQKALSEQIKGHEVGSDGANWLWALHQVSRASSNSERHWDIGADLPGTRIQSLSLDRQGNAWLGTNRGPVVLYSQADAVHVVSELERDAVLCTFEDREGNHWIGTDTSGLHVLRARKFRGESAIAGESITSVVQTTDGVAWYATRDEGLVRNDHGAITKPLHADMLKDPVVLALAPGLHGDLWFGTSDGLNHLEGRDIHRYTVADGLPDDFVRSILVDEDGSVWIGTRQGLGHLQKDRITTISSGGGPASDLIGVLFQPQGSSLKNADLWFGTQNGLTRLHDGERRNYSRKDGLPDGIVTGITEDETGGLWVSTNNGGLAKFAGDSFLSVNSPDLPRDIKAVAADGQGFLWLQSRRGISRISVKGLSACSSTQICRLLVGRYGTADGMPSDEAPENGSPTIWRTKKDELWFATRKGLAVVDFLHLPINKVPPSVVVERFSVDDAEVPFHLKDPSFSYAPRRYTFEYAALSYTLPSKVQYRFQLDGFDRQWTSAGSRRTAYYTGLPPGEYRFRVQAANEDGVWSETGAEVRFVIFPPFYRTWWFYTFLLIFVPAFIYLVYKVRVQRMQTRFDLVLNERNRMAREIHDTLVQDFIGVSIQLEILSRMIGASQPAEASQHLRRTRSLVREGLDAARHSIWNLRGGKDQDELPARLDTAIRRLSNEKTAYKLVVSGVYRLLPRATENEVLRIAQEALFNVERHAEAGIVSVDLLYTDDGLILTVRDDGRGFAARDNWSADGHYGLQGMKERAEALGAQFVITSVSGDGTTVKLIVPLSED